MQPSNPLNSPSSTPRTGGPGAGSGSGGGGAGRAVVRILVVDDSAFMRKALVQLIESDSSLKVVDTACNGEEAVDKVKRLEPDVVTLDIEMPVLNGHEALKRIRRECRTLKNGLPAVLVCSSLTTEGSRDALQALREGAADVIAKESSNYSANMGAMRDDLLEKIKAIAQSRSRVRQLLGTRPELPPYDSQALSLGGARIGLVAIGSSTGGPPVLETILKALPANLPCPVVVAQHMPAVFTKTLAERLDQTCQVRVEHGERGTRLKPGVVCIIPGGTHGHLAGTPGNVHLELSDEPKSEPYRPSTNVLFSTAAAIFGRSCLGVVLTGMGEDGKQGGMRLIQAGAKILAQDPNSSVVYGMPKAAAAIGAVVMRPDHIAQTLQSLATFATRTSTRAA